MMHDFSTGPSPERRPCTIFCDIDGTLIKHRTLSDIQSGNLKSEIIHGTIEKLLEWDQKGYRIILTTGRKESLRNVTIRELEELGIIYDMLIMGIGGGKRYIINDKKIDRDDQYAIAINLKRDEGIQNLNI